MFFDVTIIGAGVVGLSIAKFCSEQGYSVVVLEQESRAGEGISSRNSGVIHAGIYYPENSFKTKFVYRAISCYTNMPVLKELIIKELVNM